MKRLMMIMLVTGLAACSKSADRASAPARPKSVELPAVAAAQTQMPRKAAAEMGMIPIPKDKAQLARLLSMGYTVHQDHMHPPGVKSCPFDKAGGSVIE